MNRYDYMTLKDAVGRKILRVEGLHVGSTSVYFYFNNGLLLKLYHAQNCCEQVYLADVHGEQDDLEGKKILKFEETSGGECSNSWTFYHIRTSAGTLTLRWVGTSNGFYSTRVDYEWSKCLNEV